MVNAYKLTMVKEPGFKYTARRVKCPEDAAELIRQYIGESDRENCVVVALDTRSKIIGINTVSIGSLDSSIVHPREVFKFAILSNASQILIAHNHPSGNPDPSQDDVKLTQRLKGAGDLLGIDVVDHIIIGDNSFTSMKREGLI